MKRRYLAYLFWVLVGIACLTLFATVPWRNTEAAAGPVSANLVKNPGFEQGGDPAPVEWAAENLDRGTMAHVSSPVHSGRFGLRMSPNRKNTGSQLIGVGQILPAAELRGKRVQVSAWMGGTGGASAVLGLFAVRGNMESVGGLQLRSNQSGLSLQQNSFQMDAAGEKLILYLVAEGASGSAHFDDISVGPAEAAPASAAAAASAPPPSGAMTADVRVDAAASIRTIPRTLFGSNVAWIWNGNGVWNDKSDSLDPEIARLTTELGVSLFRFPAGLFSDFYHWKDGVGPRSQRPIREHHPEGDRSANTFGTEEMLSFAERVDGQVMITVNAGTGTSKEAADWARFVKTAKSGGRVRYWEVGNELYINDGSAISRPITITPQVYAKRFLEFAAAIRAVEPGGKLGAIGGENFGRYSSVSYPNWNREVLTRAGSSIDFLSVHNGYAPLLTEGDNIDVRTVYRAMLAAPVLIAQNLATLSGQIEQYAGGRNSKIEIAVTEWSPLFSGDPKSRYVDHVKTLGSALFTASVLKAFVESPRTTIANCLTLVDNAFAGFIGPRKGAYAAKAPYYALQMYTRHFGDVLVPSTTTSPTFDSTAVGLVEAVKGVPYLEIVASRSQDGQRLYILGINKSFDQPINARLQLGSFVPQPAGRVWTLNGTGIDAHTGTVLPFPEVMKWAPQAEDSTDRRFRAGGPDEVKLTESALKGAGSTFQYTFPKHSVTSIELRRR